MVTARLDEQVGVICSGWTGDLRLDATDVVDGSVYNVLLDNLYEPLEYMIDVREEAIEEGFTRPT